jgi:hypothetical protein
MCGRRTTSAAGLRLAHADTHSEVCRHCGKKHAPSLVALLDLARMAEGVGRIGRHTVVPPITVMMALVQAAETYACVAWPTSQRAA